MSYGKYGMKINVGNYSVPWSPTDTSYNIGSLLGTIWGENYNRRGIEKGTQEALDALGNGTGAPQSANNVPNNLYDLGVQSGAIGATGDTPNASAVASNTSNAPIGATGDQGLADKISAQDTIATEKWGLIKNKYNSGTKNPDGDDKIASNTANTIANNLAGFDFSTLPVTDAKMLAHPIEAQLRAAGRTDYQIQEIMKRVSPQLEAKVQGNVNQATQMLYNQYKSLVQQGRYDESSIIMGKILELNPTVGKALANQYNRNQQDFKTQYDFEKKAEYYKKNDPTFSDREARNMALYNNFRNPKEQEAWALANGYGYGIKGAGRGIGAAGGGGNGRRATGGGASASGGIFSGGFYNFDMSNANVKYVDGQIKDLEARKAAGENWSDTDEQRLQSLYDWKEDAETASGVIPTTPDWVARKTDSLINGGGSDEYIENTAAQMFGRGSWQYNVVMQRLQERRSAQYDNGYDADTYRDDSVENQINQARNAPPPPEPPNAKGHTGLVAYLDAARDSFVKNWDDFKFNKIADYVRKR